jgi:hypothetical protein
MSLLNLIKYKIVFGLIFYALVSIWLSSGLCYMFFGWGFMEAPYDAVFYFWNEMADVKGDRLRVFAATIIPVIPLAGIVFSGRWKNRIKQKVRI